MTPQRSVITTRGILTTEMGNFEDESVSIGFCAEDGQFYVITDPELSRLLMPYLFLMVTINGIIHPDGFGRKFIEPHQIVVGGKVIHIRGNRI